MMPPNWLGCPKCGTPFPPHMNAQLMFEHAKKCVVNKNGSNQTEQFIYEKISIDNTMTKFKWQKKPKSTSNDLPLNMTLSQVKKYSFQQKQRWLRRKLDELRIDWREGADWLKFDKQNLLMDSINEVQKVNMHKEVKVDFVGEKVSDAGGLLRQWIHMVVKQIFDAQSGVFTLCSTDDVMYKLKWDEDIDEFFSTKILRLFGVVMGKAIFERIPISSYLDRTILRQLTGQIARLQDIYGYDQELYKSFQYMKNNQDVKCLQTYFVVYHTVFGEIKQVELLPEGKEIPVTSENKQLYIELYIEAIIYEKVKRSILSISQGIERVFPKSWLSVFEPYELETILYGVPFINIQEWYDNTLYRQPYNRGHPIIKWFWETIENFHQDQLANILHFCTGSSRTPIQGFSKLETNRGNCSKFTIVSTKFDKRDPFPKGYTCFNRLELPMYPSLNVLKEHIIAISKREMDGIFGLD